MKKCVIFLITLAILFSAGCGNTVKENVTTLPETTITESETTTVAETTTAKETTETTTETTTEATTEMLKIKLKNIPPNPVPVDFYPNRSRLPEEFKEIYNDFLEKIINYEEFIVDFAEVSYDFNTFHNVMDAIRDDFPETRLFLFTDESIREEIHNGEPRFISVSYEYNWLVEDEFSEEYMNDYLSQMDEVCDEIISHMPKNITRTEQYRFLGKEICQRTEYTDKSDSEIPNWAWCYMNGPLLDGEGVCQAYAYAYQYLCHKAGLWCVTVSGDCHCWNMVQLENGDTYHVDLTWADESWHFEDYFLLTQEEIEYDHIPEEGAWVATGK